MAEHNLLIQLQVNAQGAREIETYTSAFKRMQRSAQDAQKQLDALMSAGGSIANRMGRVKSEMAKIANTQSGPKAEEAIKRLETEYGKLQQRLEKVRVSTDAYQRQMNRAVQFAANEMPRALAKWRSAEESLKRVEEERQRLRERIQGLMPSALSPIQYSSSFGGATARSLDLQAQQTATYVKEQQRLAAAFQQTWATLMPASNALVVYKERVQQLTWAVSQGIITENMYNEALSRAKVSLRQTSDVPMDQRTGLAGMFGRGMATAAKVSFWFVVGERFMRMTRDVARAFGDFAKAGVDAIETMNLFAVAFDKQALPMKNWIETYSKFYRFNPVRVMGEVSKWKLMLDSVGVTKELGGEKSSEFAKQITMVAADIASLRNLKLEDVEEKIQSGLAGQVRPLAAIGIDMHQATVEAFALAHGLKEVGKEMDTVSLYQARMGAIMTGAYKDFGDFSRTYYTPANQLRVMSEQWEYMRVQLSSIVVDSGSFLAILKGVNSTLSSINDWLEQGGRSKLWKQLEFFLPSPGKDDELYKYTRQGKSESRKSDIVTSSSLSDAYADVLGSEEAANLSAFKKALAAIQLWRLKGSSPFQAGSILNPVNTDIAKVPDRKFLDDVIANPEKLFKENLAATEFAGNALAPYYEAIERLRAEMEKYDSDAKEHKALTYELAAAYQALGDAIDKYSLAKGKDLQAMRARSEGSKIYNRQYREDQQQTLDFLEKYIDSQVELADSFEHNGTDSYLSRLRSTKTELESLLPSLEMQARLAEDSATAALKVARHKDKIRQIDDKILSKEKEIRKEEEKREKALMHVAKAMAVALGYGSYTPDAADIANSSLPQLVGLHKYDDLFPWMESFKTFEDYAASHPVQVDLQLKNTWKDAFDEMGNEIGSTFSRIMQNGISSALGGTSFRQAFQQSFSGLLNSISGAVSNMFMTTIFGKPADKDGSGGYTSKLFGTTGFGSFWEKMGSDQNKVFGKYGQAMFAAGMLTYYIGQQKGDKTAGAIGGAMTGASTGAMFSMPVIGAIIGAIIGGIAGYLSTSNKSGTDYHVGVNMREKAYSPEYYTKRDQLADLYDSLEGLDANSAAYRRIQKMIEKLKQELANMKASQGTRVAIGEFFTDVTGLGQDEENQMALELKERYRNISLSIRDVLIDLGSQAAAFPEISKEWSGSAGDFNAWWKQFMSHELPQTIFTEMRGSLENAMANFSSGGMHGISAERIKQELDSIANASDFDKAMIAFKRYVASLVSLGKIADELLKPINQQIAEMTRGPFEAWNAALDTTLKNIGKLVALLDGATSEEQVGYAEQGLQLAQQQLQANQSLLKQLNDFWLDSQKSLGGILTAQKERKIKAGGQGAWDSYAIEQFNSAWADISNAKDLDDLATKRAEFEKWAGEIASIIERLGGMIEKLDSAQDAFDDLANTIGKTVTDRIEQLGRSSVEVFKVGMADSIDKINDLRVGLGNLGTEDFLARLEDINSEGQSAAQALAEFVQNLYQLRTAGNKMFDELFESWDIAEAKKWGGSVGEGQWYVDQMKALEEKLKAATSHEEANAIIEKMSRYAQSLYGLDENIMVDYNGQIMEVMQWLRPFMEQQKTTYNTVMDGFGQVAEDWRIKLGLSLEGLSTMIGAKKTDLQATIDSLNDLLDTGVRSVMDQIKARVDDWKFYVEEANAALLALIQAFMRALGMLQTTQTITPSDPISSPGGPVVIPPGDWLDSPGGGTASVVTSAASNLESSINNVRAAADSLAAVVSAIGGSVVVTVNAPSQDSVAITGKGNLVNVRYRDPMRGAV